MGFVADVIKAIGGVFGTILKVAGGLLGGFLGVTKPKGTNSGVSTGRLSKQLIPEAYRKIVFGKTAAPLDLRYWEVYNNDYYDEVIALATHRINSVKELYFENALGFDASNNVQTNYSGVVTRQFKLGAPGQTALSVGSGTNWNSDSKMTGIAYILLQWHRDDKKLPSGPPNRYTQIVEGAFVYDPRRDSTQPGGSGTHRADDQSTWSYATLDSNNVPIGRNNALQALWYLLGWKIQNPSTGEWILVAGRGIEPNDINMASFITGANNCEVAGYYTDLVLSTEDDHIENEAKITADGLIGQLIDPGGLWSYYANVDDTASVAVALTDDDILDTGKVSWSEFKPMSDQYNQIVGKFVDPGVQALYQPRAYPMVRDTTYENNLGVRRRKSVDFEQVQDGLLAQKLARLRLNEGQYQAEFSAMFSYRALKAQAWSIVTYTSERFGWSKYFRVIRQGISADGSGVSMTLREVHPSIWTAGSVASIPTLPIGYRFDPATQVSITGLARTNQTYTGSDGSIYDIANVTWNALPAYVRRVEVQYKQTSSAYWMPAGNVSADLLSAVLGPLFKSTSYDVRVRTVTAYEVAGPWVSLTFTSGASGNLTASAIAAAAGTAVWSSITGANKPADNATRNVVTYSGTAPVSPIDGDLWVDISGTYAIFKLRVGGTWITGANALSAYNLLSGRPVALADINTTESTKLAGIAAGADVTGANTAANTSAVGSIPASAVSSTINSGGGVATNQVVTNSIQANNVTNTVSYYNPSALYGNGGWQNIASIAITSIGGLINLTCWTYLNGYEGYYGYGLPQFRIKRNGTIIYGPQSFISTYFAPHPDGGGTYYWNNTLISYEILDNPGSGSITYDFEFFGYNDIGFCQYNIAPRFLKATELKR